MSSKTQVSANAPRSAAENSPLSHTPPLARIRETPDHSGMSARGVIVGMLCVVLTVFTTLWVWAIWPGEGFTYIAVYVNVVLLLVLLTLANAWLARHFRKLALRRADVAVTWSMMTIATGLCHLEGLQALPHLMTYPFRPEMALRYRVQTPLPSWLVIQDPAALKGFTEGRSSLYSWPVLSAWLGPIFWWTAFLTALTGVMVGITILFRQRWVEEQRLDFPLARLPYELSQPGLPLFRNKLFWAGCVAGGGLILNNILSQFFPIWPRLSTDVDYSSLCQQAPWTGINHRAFSFHPLAVGIVYLIPNEMLLSLMVFAFWWNFQSVFAVAQGWADSPMKGFPFLQEQSLGAYLGVGLTILWLDRFYLLRMLSLAAGRPRSGSKAQAIEMRGALAAIVVCLLFLFVFCYRIGIALWTIALFLGLYYSLGLAITKIRVQVGTPSHDMAGLGASKLLPTMLGSGSFSDGSLMGMTLLSWFNLSGFGHPMPPQAEGLKLASDTGGIRLVPTALMLTPVIATLAYFWIYLHLAYSHGASALRLGTLRDLVAAQQYDALDTWLQHRADPDLARLGAVGFGLGIVSLLAALRMSNGGFLLHPYAYPLAFSGIIDAALPALLGAWIVKTYLNRFGGMRRLQASFAVAYGLIAGFSVVWMLYFLLGGLGVPLQPRPL